jgi:hypothetical protein
MHFCFKNEKQFSAFVNELTSMLNSFLKENQVDAPKIMQTYLDVIMMADHALSYGTYLMNEFSRMLESENFDELTENQDKFPVQMKKCNSKEEAEEFLNGIKKEAEEKLKEIQEENEKDDPNSLENMPTIGGIQ